MAQAYLKIISRLKKAVEDVNFEEVKACFSDKAISLIRLDKPFWKGAKLLDIAKKTNSAGIIGLVHFATELQKHDPDTPSSKDFEKNYEFDDDYFNDDDFNESEEKSFKLVEFGTASQQQDSEDNHFLIEMKGNTSSNEWLAKKIKKSSNEKLARFTAELPQQYPSTSPSLMYMEANFESTDEDFKWLFNKTVDSFPKNLKIINQFLNHRHEGNNIFSFPLGSEKTTCIYNYLLELQEFKSFFANLSNRLQDVDFVGFIKEIETLSDSETIGEIFDNQSIILVSHQLFGKFLPDNRIKQASIFIDQSIHSYLHSMSTQTDLKEYAPIEKRLRLMMHFLDKEKIADFIDRIIKNEQSLPFSEQFIFSLINLSVTQACSNEAFRSLIKFLATTNGNEKIIKFLLSPNTFAHLGFDKIGILLNTLPQVEVFNNFTEKNIKTLERILKTNFSQANNLLKDKLSHFIQLSKNKNDRGMESNQLIKIFTNNPDQKVIQNYLQKHNYIYSGFLKSKGALQEKRILDSLTNLLNYIIVISKEIKDFEKIKTHWFVNSINCNKNLINRKIQLKKAKLQTAKDFLQDLFDKTFEYSINPSSKDPQKKWANNLNKMFSNSDVYEGRLRQNIDAFLQSIEKQDFNQPSYALVSCP